MEVPRGNLENICLKNFGEILGNIWSNFKDIFFSNRKEVVVTQNTFCVSVIALSDVYFSKTLEFSIPSYGYQIFAFSISTDREKIFVILGK